MARRVFFSFHYERDIWRVSKVRNSWVTKPSIQEAGFMDAASWEEVRKKGEEAIEKWIDRQLEGTSVTVVLIGAETSNRKYVQYEIKKSWEKGNGLIGIYIHKVNDRDDKTDTKGADPFAGRYTGIKTYDWMDDDGYKNLGDWVESAYQQPQKR
jgi:hypothetical protein